MSVHQHKKEAPKQVNCKVITVSDTRSKETDESGASRLSPVVYGTKRIAGDVYEPQKDSSLDA